MSGSLSGGTDESAHRRTSPNRRSVSSWRKFPRGDKSRLSVASRALHGFLDYLHGCGVVATRAHGQPEFRTSLEKRYAHFLRNEKGLAELSLKVYRPVATDLLHYLKEEYHVTAVRQLDAPILRAFLLERAQELRHRALVSTEIYAKIDMGALQAVVRPCLAKGGVR